MAIILEGPDAAGKTSLGRLLSGQFGMNLIVSGGAPRSKEEVIQFCEMQMSHLDQLDAVIDRVTPISHPIYNPVYRNSDLLKDYLIKMLEHKQVLIVYCRPPTEALMRPEKHQWKDYDTEEHKQKVLNNQMVFIELYDELFQKIPHLHYDYTQRELDHTTQLILMLAATRSNPEYFDKLRSFQRAGSRCAQMR